MAALEVDVERLRDIMRRPIAERYVSVPLAMASATLDVGVAERRALGGGQVGRRFPVLWRIHVLDLGADLLSSYLGCFPDVIVSSICAVPVDGLSDYPDEREVLLRGPFLQILDVTAQSGRAATHVVDAVMLNSNRDHINTVATDEGEDRRMRQLFRVMVTGRRAAFAETFAAERGRDGDTVAYRELRRQSERELHELLDREQIG